MKTSSGFRNEGFVDETVHYICLFRLKNDKKYKEQKSKEIIAAICAMLNSNGGKVRIYNDSKCNSSDCLLPIVSRMLEQHIISIVGLRLTTSKICIEQKEESLVIVVKKADLLITTSYNLCLPCQTQVVQLDPREPLEKVKKDIVNRKVVWEPVELGSHHTTFYRGQDCSFREGKTCQLKHLVSRQFKRTTLADRMTGKSNKFSSFVSAFANYRGGHIYYGITEDRIVEGEVVASEEDKCDIIKKVEKGINKMIWPERIGQPKKGENWDIFFESVLDENSIAIPCTFVIVFYVAPCLGGVFTEEPECYEMVEKKVQKITFIRWVERIQYDEVSCSESITSQIKRISWSSNRIQKIYIFADEQLTQRLNNGESMQDIYKCLRSAYPDLNEISLLILSKKVMVSYRSNCFRKAEELLKQYEDLLRKTKDGGIFNAIRAYMNVALSRAKGKGEIPMEKLISDALSQAEIIEPGLISAAIYVLVATMTSFLLPKSEQVSKLPGYMATILSTRALEHLRYVHDSSMLRMDMERRAHITIALHHLRYNACGMKTEEEVVSKDVEKAKSSLAEVDKSIDEGNSINNYRKIQLSIAKAYFFIRQYEIRPDKLLLQEAFQFSKQAETLAIEGNFQEMLQRARACTALCTEELIRFAFMSSKTTKRTPLQSCS